MKIPVGPHEYQVLMVHGWVKGHEGQDCLGYFDATQHCIYISDQQSSSEMAVTLGHELMHAWRYHFPCDVQDEEALAEVVGLGFAQFMGAAMTHFTEWGRLMGHPDFHSDESGTETGASALGQASETQDMRQRLRTGRSIGGLSESGLSTYPASVPQSQAARVMQHGSWRVRIYGDE